MDNSYKNEFEFLDLTNLDDGSRDQLKGILNPTAAPPEGLILPWDRRKECHVIREEIGLADTPSEVCHENVGMDDNNNVRDSGNQKNDSCSVLVPVPFQLQYNPQIVPPVSHEWSSNMTNNLNPYTQGMTYPPNVCSPIEIQEIPPARDGGRRRRGRSNKNYKRNMNHTNEMQPSYMKPNAEQYPINVAYQPYLFVSNPPFNFQQYPVASQPIYYPPAAMYYPPPIMPNNIMPNNIMPNNMMPTNSFC